MDEKEKLDLFNKILAFAIRYFAYGFLGYMILGIVAAVCLVAAELTAGDFSFLSYLPIIGKTNGTFNLNQDIILQYFFIFSTILWILIRPILLILKRRGFTFEISTKIKIILLSIIITMPYATYYFLQILKSSIMSIFFVTIFGGLIIAVFYAITLFSMLAYLGLSLLAEFIEKTL